MIRDTTNRKQCYRRYDKCKQLQNEFGKHMKTNKNHKTEQTQGVKSGKEDNEITYMAYSVNTIEHTYLD